MPRKSLSPSAETARVNVAEAKKPLSELLGRVAYGRETIIILKRGKPMARLVPVARAARSHLADVKGWLKEDDPFFTAMEAIIAARHGRLARRPPRWKSDGAVPAAHFRRFPT